MQPVISSVARRINPKVAKGRSVVFEKPEWVSDEQSKPEAQCLVGFGAGEDAGLYERRMGPGRLMQAFK